MPGTDTLKLFHNAFGNNVKLVMILVKKHLTMVITYQLYNVVRHSSDLLENFVW